MTIEEKEEEKTPSFPSPLSYRAVVCQKAVTTVWIFDSMKLKEREREGEKKELKDAIASNNLDLDCA